EGKCGTTEHSKAIKMIRNHFSVPSISYNYICYVKRKERFIDDDRKKFKEFKEIFNDCERNIVIIITHCKQKWVNENRKTIEDYFGNYPMIGVDFPSNEDDDIDDQRKKMERRTQNLNHLLGTFSILNYNGVKLDVLNSNEATENEIQKWIGKPKIAKQRLNEGVWAM
ncbi:5079_t:CDS:2, partial [Gigaspora rosea]